MKAFIEYIGDLLLDQIALGKEPILVLPNKRPVAYLQKYMASRAQNALWFPKIYTIEDYVLHISKMQLAEPMYTAKCLFEIYTQTLQDQADSFDDFAKWWNLMISDFNDIDMYMVDSRQLFNYINEAKAIEQWNPGEKEPTKLQQHYLTFWKYLPVFYEKLNQTLSAKNLGYRGMIYRKAALHLQENNFEADAVIFAGFNALSTSEEKIIEYFLSSKKGAIYWETDDYYVADEKHEAGKFLRHYKSKWQHYANSIFFTNNSLLNDAKEINILGAPKSMMQGSLAGQISKNILNQEHVNAALIPADESLLSPLLYQLPNLANKEINISMGYPILSLPLKGLYAIVFDFINHLEKDKQALFSTKFLHQLVSHPYASILFLKNNYKAAAIELKMMKQKLLASGKIHYSLNDLESLNKNAASLNFYWLFELMIDHLSNQKFLPEIFIKINERLKDNVNELDVFKELLLMQVNVFEDVIHEIQSVYYKEETYIITQSKTLLNLIHQNLSNKTLPFIGNATGGLQFIGLLETRMLQFDEIIITSCNEGTLPGSKASGNSFIPFDIRFQFNLPTYKDSEAVFAYHFYRLLQGAKKIHLIYNTETDEFGSGEKSRFLTQLEMELKHKNKQVIINTDIIKLPALKNFARKAIRFDHTQDVDNTLKSLCEKGLSATALITYKNCALQFYFKYIERIREPDEIASEVGANIVGSVIHAVLEKIYAPLINQVISMKQIDYSFEVLETLTREAFNKIETGSDSNNGKNLLFVQTAVRIVSKFLHQEQKAIKSGVKIKLLHTEAQFESEILVKNENVKLRGTIDRMDEWNNAIRIIDYKTGSVDQSKLKVNTIEDVFEEADYDKAFQLLFYTLLYHKNYPNVSKEVEAGILSLRKISDGLYSISTSYENEELMQLFEQQLILLINKLLDTKNAFKQTNNPDICNYCAYANICMK
jgi:ATP-dependent helicase/nuclease subunit B